MPGTDTQMPDVQLSHPVFSHPIIFPDTLHPDHPASSHRSGSFSHNTPDDLDPLIQVHLFIFFHFLLSHFPALTTHGGHR